MKLALVADAPRGGKVTTEYVDRTIAACAAAAGVGPVEVGLFYSVEELPAGGKAPPIRDVRAEAPRLLQELGAWMPDHIVSLGGVPLNSLAQEPKVVVLKKEHGRTRWLDAHGWMTAWTPAIEPFRAVKSSDLHRDFANVIYKSLTRSEPLDPMSVDTVVCRDIASLEAALASLEGASVVGVDVETTGLSAYRDKLLAVGLGVAYTDWGGLSVVVPRDLLADPRATELLWDATWRKSRRSVGHNFKFDMQFLEPLVGWAPDGALLGDTLLLAHLLDERPSRPTSRARGSGLKDLVAQRYDFQYGFEFDDSGEYTEEQLDAMYEYLGLDCAYTARLWHDLHEEAELESAGIMRAHDDVLMPASRAIARCEIAGAPVDEPWVRKTVMRLASDAIDEQLELERLLPSISPTTSMTNILSPEQVADMVYGEWGWTPKPDKYGRVSGTDRSTDADHLKAAVAKYIGSQPERAAWVERLAALRKAIRTKTTYEKSVLARIDADGRVRASFLLHGASTGRLSSQGPNLQNVPAVDDRDQLPDKSWRYKLRDQSWTPDPMRRAFAPKPGRVWAEVDYSQLELRVAAAISGDQAFANVFRSGRDVHREVASAIFSKAPEDISKPERYLAKAVAFGIIYGRSAKALAGGEEMDYAERELGMTRWSEQDAEVFIRKFMRSYPDFEAWMANEYADAPTRGYVESPFGRRRRFPLFPSSRKELGEIQRQAVNTPVQSAASDICLGAMVRVQRGIEWHELDATVLFPVHDSICIECGEADIGLLEDLCRREMEQEFMGVPLKIDFEYGENWADVTKHS